MEAVAAAAEEREQWERVIEVDRMRIEAVIAVEKPELQLGSRAHTIACLQAFARYSTQRRREEADTEAARHRAVEAAAEAAWGNLDARTRELLRGSLLKRHPELAGRPDMLESLCRNRAGGLYRAERNLALWQRLPADVRAHAESKAAETFALFPREEVRQWTLCCLTFVSSEDLKRAADTTEPSGETISP
jgi:hypothetical protein